jgi:corrinoid protein of di/trimethylamine methyltransferase
MANLTELHEAIVNGDRDTATAIVQEAINEKRDPQEVIERYMIPAMDEVGRRFEAEEFFVPELLLAARAMKGALALLRPLLTETGAETRGRVVIGTVKGDLHDIGKNLVASMLEGGGFEVVDLGSDVAPEDFTRAVKEKQAGLIGMSALLTVTMPSMKTTIEALRDAGIRDEVKIMVGGAPLTSEFASEIGADGYAENAAAAVRMARDLVGK